VVPKLNALKIGVYAHTGNRPTGKFFADNGSKVVRLSKSSGDTIRVQYQGSLFGGIERIKAKLIDFPQTITDLDSVVVRVPGQIQFPSTGNYGLPPQFLKGQLERESSFRPQFRWEPFAETKENIHRIGKHGELSQYMNNYLYQIKSNTELGNPGIPLNGPKPGHSNVQIYVPRESMGIAFKNVENH